MCCTRIQVLLLAGLVSLLPAQQQQQRPSQEELLAQKLQSPFLQNAAWYIDWKAARAAAAANQKLIFGYFTTVNY